MGAPVRKIKANHNINYKILLSSVRFYIMNDNAKSENSINSPYV